MAEEGLKVVYNKKRPHSWSSYVGEISKAQKISSAVTFTL